MNSTTPSPLQRVAVIGAGIAGMSCARRLTGAGHSVHFFDTARSTSFRRFAEQACHDGTLGRWTPTSTGPGHPRNHLPPR